MNNFAVVCELLNIGGVPVNQVLPKITIYQGDSFKIKCWARDLFGRVINLTNYTVSAEIIAVPLSVTPTVNVAGEFDVNINTAQSSQVPVGTHDIKFTFTGTSSGVLTRVLAKQILEVKAI